MPTVTDVEAHTSSYFHATFYVDATAGAAWTRIAFTDARGEEFGSSHIRLKLIGANGVNFSFDGRTTIADAARVVEGLLDSSDTLIELRDKCATGIWIQRSGGTDGEVRILAWR